MTNYPSTNFIKIPETSGRTESGTPTAYRLAQDPWGKIMLQGAYQWSDGMDGGFEWRDIPTVMKR